MSSLDRALKTIRHEILTKEYEEALWCNLTLEGWLKFWDKWFDVMEKEIRIHISKKNINKFLKNK